MSNFPVKYVYYDVYEVMNAFGIKWVADLFPPGYILNNHTLVKMFRPFDEDTLQDWDADYDGKLPLWQQNRLRIYEKLGQIDLHIWW